MLKVLKKHNLSIKAIYVSILAAFFLLSTSHMFFTSYTNVAAAYKERNKNKLSLSVSKVDTVNVEYIQDLQIKTNHYTKKYDASDSSSGLYGLSTDIVMTYDFLGVNYVSNFDNTYINNTLSSFNSPRGPPTHFFKLVKV